MRNALALPAYAFPDSANLDVRGISNALSEYTQGVRQDRRDLFDRDMRTKQFGLQEQANTRASQSHDMEMQKAKVGQIAGIAAVALNEKDPARQAQMMQQAYALHPGMTDHLTRAGVNPGDHVGTAKFILAEARGFGVYNPLDDEAKGAQIDLTKKQAANVGADNYKAGDGFIYNSRTGEVKPLPEGTGNTKTSLNPTWGQDANGNLVLMQTTSQGKAVKTELPAGVQATKGVMKVDAGTHFILLNQMTGQSIGVLPKDVAGKEAAEEVGKAAGKAQASLPQIEDAATIALDTIDKIRKHPGKAYGIGAAGVLPGIPGTQQRGFVALVDQAKGQVFLDAFNALRGGGAITEIEGEKATKARARMDRAQTQEDFDAALADYEAVIRRGLATARSNAKLRGPDTVRAAPAGPGTGQPQPKGALAPGNYVYDPATGQLRPAQ